MENVQQATIAFELPLSVAYLSASALGLALASWKSFHWPPKLELKTNRPYLDLGLGMLAVLGILGLGQAYRAGFLLPTGNQDWLGRLAWMVDTLLIYSPIALVLLARRQGPETVFLRREALAQKVGLGVVLGLLAVALFLGFRGEVTRYPDFLRQALQPERIATKFLPVFLEGVGLAFLFVRLRWAIGQMAALAVPAVLFALAHVPNHLGSGWPAGQIGVFLVTDAALVTAILFAAQQTQDVIWLGIVHYLMDVVIGAV